METTKTDAGWTTTKYAATPNMPVYLNAFLISTDDLKEDSLDLMAEDFAVPGATAVKYPVDFLSTNSNRSNEP